MSILPLYLLAVTTAPTSRPATGPSSLDPLTWVGWAQVAGCIAFALAVAAFAGVFRSRSIDGPDRLANGTPAIVLWMIAIGGFVASIVAQMISFATMHVSAESLTMHQTVVLSCFGTAVGFGSLGLFHAIRDPQSLDRLGFSFPKLRRALHPGLVGALVAIPLMFAAVGIIQEVWRVCGFAPPEEHVLLKVFSESAVPIDKWLVIFSAVILAPLFEEMLFRGHVQTAVLAMLGRTKSRGFEVVIANYESPPQVLTVNVIPTAHRWAAICIAAALFALAHGALWMMPPLFLLAVCLGYAYERTGNLWTNIIMHASFNAVSIGLEYWGMHAH